MATIMAGAAPLSNPSQGVEEAHHWRPLLETAQADTVFAATAAASDPFASLLHATVVPPLASAITNVWEPRDAEPLLTWMETWGHTLPHSVQSAILDNLVFPKAGRSNSHDSSGPQRCLGSHEEAAFATRRETEGSYLLQLSRTVEAWEPQAESVPLHAWLHPWLPYLGRQFEALYPTIRFRLSTALRAWHPSDSSALALLAPWHLVSLAISMPEDL